MLCGTRFVLCDRPNLSDKLNQIFLKIFKLSHLLRCTFYVVNVGSKRVQRLWKCTTVFMGFIVELLYASFYKLLLKSW